MSGCPASAPLPRSPWRVGGLSASRTACLGPVSLPWARVGACRCGVSCQRAGPPLPAHSLHTTLLAMEKRLPTKKTIPLFPLLFPPADPHDPIHTLPVVKGFCPNACPAKSQIPNNRHPPTSNPIALFAHFLATIVHQKSPVRHTQVAATAHKRHG